MAELVLGIQQDATSQDRAHAQQTTRETVGALAAQDLSEVSRDEVLVRDLMAWEDMESGADNGWTTGNNEWAQNGMSADSYNEVYNFDSDSNAEKKAIGIYGFSSLSGDTDVTEVRLTTPTGATFARVDLSGVDLDDDGFALLSDPIVLRVEEDADMEFYTTAANDQQIKLEGAVGEPSGETLDESRRFKSKRQ